jgi:hypothetical protein
MVWFGGPTTHHKFPQLIRDTVPLILSIWPRGAQLFGDPRVKDQSVTRVVEEGFLFRDALKYQHPERASVGFLCWRDTSVFDLFRGCIPAIIPGVRGLS